MYRREFPTKKGWTIYPARFWERTKDGWVSRERTRNDEPLTKVHDRIFGVDEDGVRG